MFCVCFVFFFFSSRRRHTRCSRDWSSDVCSSDLRFVVERVQVVGWMSLVPGGGGRPHTLGVMAAGQPPDLWPAVLQRSLAYVAQQHPGPVWCSLRHYDEAGIRLLRSEGFEVIASQTLMVRELPLKIPARMRVRIKDKRLVPQYG